MSVRDKLAEIISDAENCTDEEGSWALPEDVADAVVAAGWRPPARRRKSHGGKNTKSTPSSKQSKGSTHA